jgi:hypothetical protein
VSPIDGGENRQGSQAKDVDHSGHWVRPGGPAGCDGPRHHGGLGYILQQHQRVRNIADCVARAYDVEGMNVGTVAAGRIGLAVLKR